MSEPLVKSAFLWVGFASFALAVPPRPPIAEPVPTRAQLFDLDQVRLLDGPFKTAQDTDAAYLLKLEPDRLLAWFCKEAGLKPKAEVYGGWESLGVAGHTCGHYMSAIAQLTEHVFQFHPDAPVMDYYERTLYNHILSTLRPHEDGFVYYTTMSPGSYRSYSTDFDSFWCCVDTGMENHAKYGKAIYAHEGADKLLVNFFIASTLAWQDAGLKVEQKTAFPEEQGSTLVFHPVAPMKMEVDVRHPYWVAPGALKLTVNGEAQAIRAQPGEYAAIQREWKEGDALRVETPMALHTEMLPHSKDYVSILYGPLVLAGKLGLQGLTLADFTTIDMVVRKPSTEKETAVIVGKIPDMLSHIKPVEGEPLMFESDGLIKPRDVRMAPFYKLVNERYTIYWHVLDPAE